MKQILTFAVILLAILSMVNAFPFVKREFEQCPGIPTPPKLDVTIDPVTIIPGHVETFTVSGTLLKDITEEYSLVISIDDIDGTPLVDATIVDICSIEKCPIKAGTPFEIKTEVTIPPTLPPKIILGVAIVSLTLPVDIIGCSMDTVDVQ